MYLRTKFQVSSVILTSVRQGVIPPLQNKPLKSPPRLGLRITNSGMKGPVLFLQYKECQHCLQLIHKNFQTYCVQNLCLSKKILCYLYFLTLNYLSEILGKWSNRTVCKLMNLTIIVFHRTSRKVAFRSKYKKKFAQCRWQSLKRS